MKAFWTRAFLLAGGTAACATAPKRPEVDRSFTASGFIRVVSTDCDDVTVSRGDGMTLGRAPYTCDNRAGLPPAQIVVTVPQPADVSLEGKGAAHARASNTAKADANGTGCVAISSGAKCSVRRDGLASITCN